MSHKNRKVRKHEKGGISKSETNANIVPKYLYGRLSMDGKKHSTKKEHTL
jgi:hypothetical protein